MYYVSERIGGCESDRKEISVTLNRVNVPVAEGEQHFCESVEPTVRDLFAVGEEIRWYSFPSGGQPISENERLVEGAIYYAANVSAGDGCESIERTPVIARVHPCEVEVYNLVTRDGNSKNEYLRIKNIESFPDNRMEIYNRYGVLVWAVDGYGQEGRLFYGESNQPNISQSELGLPTGNYLYVLSYRIPTDNRTEKVTGYLYLVNTQRNVP